MLNYIPLIYKDELLYSVIGRYHKTSGNTSYKKTLIDIFGTDTIVPILEFPCHLEEFTKKIPSSVNFKSADRVIKENTLFPLYKPFLSEDTSEEIINSMKYGDGGKVKLKSGVVAGGICKKQHIYYCPECAKTEIEEYGSAYIHRTHQVQGVLVCDKHKCLLKPYNQGFESRLKYVYLEKDKLETEGEYFDGSSFMNSLTLISTEVHYILNEGTKYSFAFNQDKVNSKIREELDRQGYITLGGRVKQKKLIEDFKEFYGLKLLTELESNIDIGENDNWLTKLTRKPRTAIHPIRNILAIVFLFGDVKSFFELNVSEKKPFGESPWVCMNPFCKGYKKRVVTECEVTSDYKTRELVGTFTCSCGFSFSRKQKDDIYNVGTIKKYGVIWENSLIKALEDGGSIRSIARRMQCDSKTVKKYALKLGYDDYIPVKTNASIAKDVNLTEKEMEEAYKRDILAFLKKNKSSSRLELMRNLYREYIFIYNSDKDWLDIVAPKHKKKVKAKKSKNNKWEQEDIRILVLLKKEYLNVFSERKFRITKSLLGRRINKLAALEKNLDKLPRTKQYLEEICETVEQFQVRRVEYICNEKIKKGEVLVEWEILREAGIRSVGSNFIIEEIRKIINNN